jgi:hypothetical protein
MCSESTRRKLSGGIEYPHLEQMVSSDAMTFFRLIFCLLGIEGVRPLTICTVRASSLPDFIGRGSGDSAQHIPNNFKALGCDFARVVYHRKFTIVREWSSADRYT